MNTFITKSEEDGIHIQIEKKMSRSRSYLWTKDSNEDQDELNEDLFSETLAKIYIKQQKYEKAYK